MGGPLTEGGHDPRADTTPRDDYGRRLKGSRLLEYMDQGPLGLMRSIMAIGGVLLRRMSRSCKVCGE